MNLSSKHQITKLPRVNTVLILNTCSFFVCYFLGLGIITAAISLLLLHKDRKILALHPNVTNLKAYKIAQITGWLVFILNSIYFLIWLSILTHIGWDNLMNPEVMQDPKFLKNIF